MLLRDLLEEDYYVVSFQLDNILSLALYKVKSSDWVTLWVLTDLEDEHIHGIHSRV
jgi:hypothetical protein